MTDDEYKSFVSLKRHLIDATLSWCTEIGYTPHLTVIAGYPVFKRDGSSEPFSDFIGIQPNVHGVIVFDVSGTAVRKFEYLDDYLYFETKFGGRVKAVTIPIGAIANVHSMETLAGVPLPILDQPMLVWDDARTTNVDAVEVKAKPDTKDAGTKKKIPSFLTVVK
jgi:stringent starvation protein B